MSSNYYYLVAGLPEIILDEGRTRLACSEFTSEAREQLSDADFTAFSCLLYPFDNYNLVTLFDKLERPFDERGLFSEEDLAAGLKFPDDLPGYMAAFIESARENRFPVSGLTSADQLAWHFYGTMVAHEQPFISEWYSFDRTLRNLVAGINCRNNIEHLDALATDRDTSLTAAIIGRDDAAEAILRSNAADFGLGSLFTATEKVLALSHGSLADFDKGLDAIRWDTLGEMTESCYFSAETVFAFFVKLSMVERWQKLDPKTGQARLDKLIDELRTSYTAPSMF